MTSTISKEVFGDLPDGKKADLYTLTNANGMTVKITNYGGIITELTAKDKSGKWEDVVLGFDSSSSLHWRKSIFRSTWLVVMETVLPMGNLHWTAKHIRCQSTTARILYTAVLTVLTKNYGMLLKSKRIQLLVLN